MTAGTDMLLSRSDVILAPDSKRVIARRYVAGDETRVDAVVERVMELDEDAVAMLLVDVLTRYASRHRDIEAVFDRHCEAVVAPRHDLGDCTPKRRRLLGAYFTCEYSLESVALFNPSMVLHPNQGGLAPGAARFVVSLRGCGEGHISSIQFRSGTVDAGGAVKLDTVSRYAAAAHPVNDHLRNKNRLFLKLQEMGAYSPIVNPIFQLLDDEYTLRDLQKAIADARRHCRDARTFGEIADTMLWLARSSYRLEFPAESDLSERVIFPVTENESRGIEDARFVRFVDGDGAYSYYATYTAYNGWQILPQIIHTTDFLHFRVNTINGRCAQNKGMALFPRKIADRFVMISRLDGENIYVLRSDDIHFWNEGEKIRGPGSPWEFIQIGNCGSPLETDAGWILVTHGVGPMREYWIGAMLLDRDDPSRVIGHTQNPILVPTEQERDGYVPNVLYSCGGMIHGGNIILPYAYSDTATRFATIPVDGLLSRFVRR